MTIQQLQYVVALNKYKNFIKAAEACLVTQPTITTQLKKLEEEVGMLIFDRTKVPLEVTRDGERFVVQAQEILDQIKELKSWVNKSVDDVKGEVRIGVIPTIAPYLLPLLIKELLESYPDLHIEVEEMTSLQLIAAVKNEHIDLGILAGPINESGIREEDLYEEPFLIYASVGHNLLKHAQITPKMLEVYDDLWVLEHGHCMSTQTLNICNHKRGGVNHKFNYKSGSFDALLRMLKIQGGYTLVPYLMHTELDQAQVKSFKNPVPARNVVLIAKKTYNKEGVIDAFKNAVEKILPSEIKTFGAVKRIPWK